MEYKSGDKILIIFCDTLFLGGQGHKVLQLLGYCSSDLHVASFSRLLAVQMQLKVPAADSAPCSLRDTDAVRSCSNKFKKSIQKLNF